MKEKERFLSLMGAAALTSSMMLYRLRCRLR